MNPPNDSSVIELLTSVLTRLDKQDAEFEYLKREVKEISAQTKITNGRVSALEVYRITQEAIRTDREQRAVRLETGKLALTCAILGGPLSALLGVVLTLLFIH